MKIALFHLQTSVDNIRSSLSLEILNSNTMSTSSEPKLEEKSLTHFESSDTLSTVTSSISTPLASPPPASSHNQKHVTFCTKVQFRGTLPRNSYTEEERDKTWYSRNELRKMQRRSFLGKHSIREIFYHSRDTHVAFSSRLVNFSANAA